MVAVVADVSMSSFTDPVATSIILWSSGGFIELFGGYVSASVDGWQAVAKLVNSWVTTAGIVVGGLWVYYNYIRGRAYQQRLEPNVVGTIECKGGLSYISIVYELKRVMAHQRML